MSEIKDNSSLQNVKLFSRLLLHRVIRYGKISQVFITIEMNWMKKHVVMSTHLHNQNMSQVWVFFFAKKTYKKLFCDFF